MKIEKPGFYRTRGGQKVEVAAINPNAAEHSRCIGWLNGMIFSCHINGSILSYKNHDADIVSEWIEPVLWDWSTTPPWLNYLAMDEDGKWMLYSKKPEIQSQWFVCMETVAPVPVKYAPKWFGDWKQSLTVRPGYEEAK